MTQPISFDQPLGQVRDGRVFVDSAWFRYFVDVGEVDLTEDVTGVLPVANGGTGVTSLTPALTPVTFQNGWADFGGAFQTVGYYIDAMSVVHLRGLMSGGAIAAAAFTLPVGFRPLKSEIFACASNGAFGSLSVSSAGVVTPDVGSNVFFSLAGVNFRVDA